MIERSDGRQVASLYLVAGSLQGFINYLSHRDDGFFLELLADDLDRDRRVAEQLWLICAGVARSGQPCFRDERGEEPYRGHRRACLRRHESRAAAPWRRGLGRLE